MSWEERRIEHLAYEVRDTVDPGAFGDAEVDHYSIPALDATGRPETQPASQIQSHKQWLRGGEVLLSRLNPRKARVLRVPPLTERVALASSEFIVLRPHSVAPRFLEYVLLSEVTRQTLNGAVQSVTRSHQRIRPEQLLKLRVAVPIERQRQRWIADFLDTETHRVDALIAKKRRMIELMRERFWQSVDTKFRALDHVLRHKLTWLAHTWCDGPFGSSLTSAHYSGSGARVVRLGNVGSGEFVNVDQAFVPVEYFASLRRHEVLEGDLIVAGLGDENRPLARACVAPELGPAMVKADCFRFRLRTESVSPDFVAWYLSSPSAVAGSAVLAQGSTRARANLATVCGLRVPLPNQSVQQLVVESIQRERSALSDVEARLKQQVNLLEEHRQALITAAVTGELEVPGVAA